MKKKWVKTILIMFFLIGLGSWVYFFPYQKHVAQEATNQYLKAQGVPQRNIQSREIKRDWKMGGYITNIKYKNEPHLVYEYKYHESYAKAGYPYGIFFTPTKFGTDVDDKEVKYPSLPKSHQQ